MNKNDEKTDPGWFCQEQLDVLYVAQDRGTLGDRNRWRALQQA